MDEKVLLNIDSCAARLSIGRTKLLQLLAAGDIRAVRIGRAVRIHVDEVDRYARRLLDEATDDGRADRPGGG